MPFTFNLNKVFKISYEIGIVPQYSWDSSSHLPHRSIREKQVPQPQHKRATKLVKWETSLSLGFKWIKRPHCSIKIQITSLSEPLLLLKSFSAAMWSYSLKHFLPIASTFPRGKSSHLLLLGSFHPPACLRTSDPHTIFFFDRGFSLIFGGRCWFLFCFSFLLVGELHREVSSISQSLCNLVLSFDHTASQQIQKQCSLSTGTFDYYVTHSVLFIYGGFCCSYSISIHAICLTPTMKFLEHRSCDWKLGIQLQVWIGNNWNPRAPTLPHNSQTHHRFSVTT